MVDKWTQYELIYHGIKKDVNEIVQNKLLTRESLQESDEGNYTHTNPCAFKKNSSGSIVIDEEFMGSCLLEYSSTYLNLFLLECQEQQLDIVAQHFASRQTVEDQKMTKKIVSIGWIAFLEIYIHIAQIKDRLPAELVENVTIDGTTTIMSYAQVLHDAIRPNNYGNSTDSTLDERKYGVYRDIYKQWKQFFFKFYSKPSICEKAQTVNQLFAD